MTTTAGSLALEGSIPPRDAFVADEAARSGRRAARQDQSERVGEFPVHPFDERLERARRSDEESVRARQESMRVELGLRRRHRSQPAPPWRSGRRRTARSSVRPAQRHGRHQAHAGTDLPGGNHSHRPQPGHAGPMARTVTDAAILLGVLAGIDPRGSRDLRRPRLAFCPTIQVSRSRRIEGCPYRSGPAVFRFQRELDD